MTSFTTKYRSHVENTPIIWKSHLSGPDWIVRISQYFAEMTFGIVSSPEKDVDEFLIVSSELMWTKPWSPSTGSWFGARSNLLEEEQNGGSVKGES